MTHKTEAAVYSWQRKGWPRFTFDRAALGKSAATVERAVATLVKAGRVEHRGSKKTGGYYLRGGAS